MIVAASAAQCDIELVAAWSISRSAKLSVKHPDLLIAAAAEVAGVQFLHYDEDYDRIASITGQPVDWLAPRGSLRTDS